MSPEAAEKHPQIAKGWDLLQKMLSHNWSIWLCVLVLGIVWAICNFTSIIATPGEDGIVGGLIAVLFTEGLRAAIKTFKDQRAKSDEGN